MTSVSDEAHRAVSFGEMADALVAAFSAAEGVGLLADSLTQREALNATGIVARKYGREDWNAFR
jgi:lipoate-protein ligase A